MDGQEEESKGDAAQAEDVSLHIDAPVKHEELYDYAKSHTMPVVKKSKSKLGYVIDFVVLSWCFILPIIAASQRELDASSGTTTCSVSMPVLPDGTHSFSIVNDTCTSAGCSVVCSTADPEVFKPLSQLWKVFLGLIPIVVVFEGILSFQLSSRYVAPFSMLYTVVLGFLFFRDASYFQSDGTLYPTAATITGLSSLIVVDRFFWAIIEYVFNVFAAFFFMRVLELWGAVESMREEFTSMAKTPTRKVVVVGFAFAILLAVVAPGGSNYIVAGAILIEMNPSNLPDGPLREAANVRIGTLCLFGNALISAFNLLGICITTIAEDVKDLAYDHPNDVEYGAKQIGRLFSLQFFLFSVVTPYIMAWMYSGQPTMKAKFAELKPDMPMLFAMGFVYATAQLLTSWFIGPELPCLTAGGLSLVYYVAAENWGNWQVPSMKKRAYMIPFLVLIGVLLIMRLIPFVEEGVTGDWGDDDGTAESILNPWLWNVNSGGVSFKRTLPWLWHSGIIVAIIAVLTPFITPFRAPPLITDKESLISGLRLDDGTLNPVQGRPVAAHSHDTPTPHERFQRIRLRLMAVAMMKSVNKKERRKKVLMTACKEAIADVLPVVVSITSFASIAKLMDRFGMIQTIADFLVQGLESVPAIYVLLMPVIGTLGSGLTGSTTTSNFLFGRLQVATASNLGLVAPGSNTVYEVAATNILGASAGEIIAPMNAVVITLMKGIGGTEERLISKVMPLAITWLFATMVVSVIFIVPTGGFIN